VLQSSRNLCIVIGKARLGALTKCVIDKTRGVIFLAANASKSDRLTRNFAPNRRKSSRERKKLRFLPKIWQKTSKMRVLPTRIPLRA